MRFVVNFNDSAEMANIRQKLEPDHLCCLEQHHAEISMASGLNNEDGSNLISQLVLANQKGLTK